MILIAAEVLAVSFHLALNISRISLSRPANTYAGGVHE